MLILTIAGELIKVGLWGQEIVSGGGRWCGGNVEKYYEIKSYNILYKAVCRPFNSKNLFISSLI